MSFRKTFKNKLIQLTKEYLKKYKISVSIPNSIFNQTTLDYTPKFEMGHYASNLAMLLAKQLKEKPHDIAERLIFYFLNDSFFNLNIQKIDIAGPGFLNFFLQTRVFFFFFQKQFSLEKWLDSAFEINLKNNQDKIHFEFVSANPTGPLNIVSARSAAVGDSICRVLKRVKKKVFKEYYVNDFGNQVHLLGVSFAIRHLQSKGISVNIPENGYHGEYIKAILGEILKAKELPETLKEITSLKEKSKEEVDSWINKAAYFFTPLAIEFFLNLHKKDLKDFRVDFNHFFSEKSLHEEGLVEKAFQLLLERGYVYQKEKASFFKSTHFNDNKDRALKKKDSTSTYFLADIAYHLSKFERGYTQIYDIWGPDHHGYISRLKGAMKASYDNFEKSKKSFEVLIVQQINLLEQGKVVKMSKRLGKFESMRDLIKKIPIDVSRYFFVSRSQSQHLNFNLELALDESHKNPVYYIQYAHARIYSIFKEYLGEKISSESTKSAFKINILLESLNDRDLITTHAQKLFSKGDREQLIFELFKFIDELEMISENLEIHKLTIYLYNLAHCFTKLYHHPENRIIDLLNNESETKHAEGLLLLRLCQVTAMILKEGLSLLGISTPTTM